MWSIVWKYKKGIYNYIINLAKAIDMRPSVLVDTFKDYLHVSVTLSNQDWAVEL